MHDSIPPPSLSLHFAPHRSLRTRTAQDQRCGLRVLHLHHQTRECPGAGGQASSGPGTTMAAVVVAVEAAAMPSRGGGACRSKQAYLVRSLYWRLRAGIRRLQSERAGRWRSRATRLSFHYDALSYALNFDDGRASADVVRW